MLLWIVSLVLSAVVVFGIHIPRSDSTFQEPGYSTASSATYNGLSKVTWGLVLMWVTIGCVKGYGGQRMMRYTKVKAKKVVVRRPTLN